MEIMHDLGVNSIFTPKGLSLTKKNHKANFSYDFSACPDLAQTIAVVCAAKGIKAEFTGLESLKIKETDRILALQNELKKIGTSLIEENGRKWTLTPIGHLEEKRGAIDIETYDDHRMAMAFAPLATLMDIKIHNPSVTDKSYPSFWNDMEKARFELEFN